ncbi:hypothetical protein K504DRAFT_457408 [Pleomassaria siparia CBS 279.74]|uniref:Uncharacterized protein n=1 Tax=Pleomassaria siparia CBS 279.74 TaxID=1314801 RepID=A0A6G1KSD6_9PLEO|nr:hypothetical protein K504DRAFT_457408 [Pleomassaria siparia CBS 279.74]
MVMSWTPDNDRILLLKLIETHSIDVKPSLIADAWPTGGSKPTPRAISERFVRLRKDAGIPTARSRGGRGGSRVVGVPKTPTSSAKKRKMNKKMDSDESDADEHLTDNDEETTTPTPARKAVAGSARTAKTPRFGKAFSNVNNSMSGGSPSAGLIKREPVDHFEVSNFNEQMARATSLCVATNGHSVNDQFDMNNKFGMPTPGGSGQDESHSSSDDIMSFAYGGGTHSHGMSGMNMDIGHRGHQMSGLESFQSGLDIDGFDDLPSSSFDSASMPNNGNGNGNDMIFGMGNTHSSPAGRGLSTGTERLNIGSNSPFVTDRGGGGNLTPLSKPRPRKPNSGTTPKKAASGSKPNREHVNSIKLESPVQERRQRTPRQASMFAEQNLSKVLRAQKEADDEDGMRSSEEDSAVSAYDDDENA